MFENIILKYSFVIFVINCIWCVLPMLFFICGFFYSQVGDIMCHGDCCIGLFFILNKNIPL